MKNNQNQKNFASRRNGARGSRSFGTSIGARLDAGQKGEMYKTARRAVSLARLEDETGWLAAEIAAKKNEEETRHQARLAREAAEAAHERRIAELAAEFGVDARAERADLEAILASRVRRMDEVAKELEVDIKSTSYEEYLLLAELAA